MNKAINRFLSLLLVVYVSALAYMLLIGLLEGVAIVQNGLFLWSIGAVFGIMGYQVSKEIKRGKSKGKHYD